MWRNPPNEIHVSGAMRAAAYLILCLTLLGGAATCIAAESRSAGFTFAALGDAPYHDDEEPAFIAIMAELNREKLAFAVHVGDFKSGYSDCSDALYLQRKEWFELSRHPFVYVPGDNEWTDCWRRAAGRYDPLERLKKLREVFFADAASLGQHRLAFTRQSDIEARYPYPEHARWVYENVLFVTFNVPGSDNNFARDRAEFSARDAAVREWIAQSFRFARAQRLAGVILVMQANPWLAVGARRYGFTPLISAITSETLAFPGEVVLVHGDTHRFRVDHPLLHPDTRRPLANFTRIEVYGSPSVNWVRVRVESVDGKLKFEVTPGS
jgi:hypothetical protein